MSRKPSTSAHQSSNTSDWRAPLAVFFSSRRMIAAASPSGVGRVSGLARLDMGRLARRAVRRRRDVHHVILLVGDDAAEANRLAALGAAVDDPRLTLPASLQVPALFG